MSKFRLKDRVRVIDAECPRFDQVGVVIAHDPYFIHAYEVKIGDDFTQYYAARHLVLAPNEGEYQ